MEKGDDNLDRLRKLDSGDSDDELCEIDKRLDEYCALGFWIYEWIRRYPEVCAEFMQLVK